MAVLWGCAKPETAHRTAELLQDRQVLHLATLNECECWCLVSPPHLQALHVRGKKNLVPQPTYPWPPWPGPSSQRPASSHTHPTLRS